MSCFYKTFKTRNKSTCIYCIIRNEPNRMIMQLVWNYTGILLPVNLDDYKILGLSNYQILPGI